MNAFESNSSEKQTFSMENVYKSSDEDEVSQRVKKRIQTFSDSDTEKENSRNVNNSIKGDSDSDADSVIVRKSVPFKSRIVMNESDSDSEGESPSKVPVFKNEEQQMRMNNKRSKLKQKFEGLLSSKSKHPVSLSDKQSSEDEKTEQSEEDENDMSSIASIKQKIKKSMAVSSSIYDPDTSDEESNMNKNNASKQGRKKPQKSTKMIDAKAIRMSAKQAMENMQLIKSESNRMLREKAVSLPYHRPKALTLKDIMSRRKPAVTPDGKVLPIKMNEKQLKQYALQLEQRQKEMMELCRSESDDDEDDDTAKSDSGDKIQTPPLADTEKKDLETNTNLAEPVIVDKETNDNIAEIFENADEAINSTHTDSIKDIQVETTMPDINIEETIANSNNETSKNDKEVMNEENRKDINLLEGKENNAMDIELVNENNMVNSTEHISENYHIKSSESELGEIDETEPKQRIPNACSEQESQLISLHYTENDSENAKDADNLCEKLEKLQHIDTLKPKDISNNDLQEDFFSDDDMNMEDIDKLIENAEIMNDKDGNKESSIFKDPLTVKPKLAGAPGMVIDLDGTDTKPMRSGVELLKERFIYFSKLKTPEELEREKEKVLKPGSLHLKLKHDLQDQIAEQRSLEWAKRLEEEKKLHQEMDTILDDGEEAEDSIEKIEAKIDEEDDPEEESESEEELVENDIEMKDKPTKHNPMLDDEAEESDDVENDGENEQIEIEEADNSDESSEDEESSESEEESDTKPRKGRILKAFEDSDDEENTVAESESANIVDQNAVESNEKQSNNTDDPEMVVNSSDIQSSSQDGVIQLAQKHKSVSDDLFPSQESATLNIEKTKQDANDDLLGTQTFSISSAKPTNFLCPSQPYHDPSLNGVTENLSQNLPGSQLGTQCSQSQPLGEDILALCTGKFYDSEFVSMTDEKPIESVDGKDLSQNCIEKSQHFDTNEDSMKQTENINISGENIEENVDNLVEKDDIQIVKENTLLKSLMNELDDAEFDKPKQNKFFTGAAQNKSVTVEAIQPKKRLVIDSDDENNENLDVSMSKKKKLKKKKLEQRALQISDDEDEEEDFGLEDEGLSEDDEERIVDYDSEENEIEIKPEKLKKKRKANDFLEQEAELTSEDEWVGSGDEDEQGLDAMEREEGDDDVFHQGKLRNELGQIHMRDVLDQDKREVRLLQELLFEDGDLGGGHRQRKFRWKNAGDEEAGTIPDDLTDTQEEEFESEEQWRKQRHEREVFLKQMENQEEDIGSPNITVNRTTIIKANLMSKSMSTLLMEVNQSEIETVDSSILIEKKNVKDIPSPKKSFSILQQKYHNSMLSRGRGALERLAALATPLAADDDATKIASLGTRKRNFVFTALTPDEEQPKVTIKRKADVTGTPKLVKKIRLEEKQTNVKSSLLDHFNT